MRIPRIYIDTPISTGSLISLPIEAHRHIANVLRLKEKNKLILFNGLGREYLSEIISVEKKTTVVSVKNESDISSQSAINIELGLALIKNDRFDFALQKSVELGVNSITPLMAHRSTIKLDSKRARKKQAHWQGIIQNACEQSGQNYLPAMNPLHSIADWLASSTTAGIVFEPTASHTLSSLRAEKNLRVIIGPEGGFTEVELELISQHGFDKVKLGPRILRAETAAICAVSALQVLWGDLNV